ncbi:hypothetical protein NHQ30_006272 [Ciborinia camelliae]|nr:hypothetical protein NHQ30_006272 [Ciborinia camelliae]
MPHEFDPPLASMQEYNSVRNDEKYGKFERLRTMSLYTMMFLSMASPILHMSSIIAWYIDLLSTLGFMVIVIWTHPEEIKKFGPVVLPTAALLLVILFASRVSLLEIMPWMPFAISLWLLITVYSCPAMVALIQEVLQGSKQELSKHGRYLHNVARDDEEDQEQALIFDLNQKEPPKNTFQSAINRDIAFMGRPASTLSTNSSDIDLDEGDAIGKFVAARFLSHFPGEDARFMNVSNQVRFHSRDIPIHCLAAPEDSLIGNNSTTGSTIHDYT